MILSTTSTLDGWEVERYMGPVSAHMVIGTGLLTEFFSSFTDLFGARSNSYRNKIREIEVQALGLLELEARRKGAGAVIGLRVDHDEISGAGKSMMMVTALGTAVRIRRTAVSGVAGPDTSQQLTAGVRLRDGQVLSSKEVVNQVLRERMLESAGDGSLVFTEEVWRIITDLQLAAIAPAVLRHHAKVLKDTFHTEVEKNAHYVTQFFRSLPAEETLPHLYSGLVHQPAAAELIHNLIVEMGCADYDRILDLIQGSDRSVASRALQTLIAQPAFYSSGDVETIERIIEAIPIVFPPIPSTERSRVLSSKTKQVWICYCGEDSDAEVDRCGRCGRDRFGFFRKQLSPNAAVSLLERRLRALKGLLRQSDVSTDPATAG